MKHKKVIFIIGFLLLISCYLYIIYSSVDYKTIHINDKERIEGDYLIYTEDEVFKNTDSLLFMKFDSSDVYNKLKIDGRYRVKVYGFRIPFFSMYRNIVKINTIVNEIKCHSELNIKDYKLNGENQT